LKRWEELSLFHGLPYGIVQKLFLSASSDNFPLLPENSSGLPFLSFFCIPFFPSSLRLPAGPIAVLRGSKTLRYSIFFDLFFSPIEQKHGSFLFPTGISKTILVFLCVRHSHFSGYSDLLICPPFAIGVFIVVSLSSPCFFFHAL